MRQSTALKSREKITLNLISMPPWPPGVSSANSRSSVALQRQVRPRHFLLRVLHSFPIHRGWAPGLTGPSVPHRWLPPHRAAGAPLPLQPHAWPCPHCPWTACVWFRSLPWEPLSLKFFFQVSEQASFLCPSYLRPNVSIFEHLPSLPLGRTGLCLIPSCSPYLILQHSSPYPLYHICVYSLSASI